MKMIENFRTKVQSVVPRNVTRYREMLQRKNWDKLSENLQPLSERELLDLLAVCLAERPQQYLLKRIHQKYAKVRTARERLQLGVGVLD